MAWALISTSAAILLVAVTTQQILKTKTGSQRIRTTEGKLSQFLYNKWYVDELYDKWIVGPLWRISHACWKRFDQGLIDRSVNLSGRTAKGIGWIGSLFQTGQVNTYAFFLAVGLLAVLVMVVI